MRAYGGKLIDDKSLYLYLLMAESEEAATGRCMVLDGGDL